MIDAERIVYWLTSGKVILVIIIINIALWCAAFWYQQKCIRGGKDKCE